MRIFTAFAFSVTMVGALHQPSRADAGGVSASGMLNLLPVGTFRAELGNDSDSEDTAFAYGIAAQVDYHVTGNISVGLAPRYTLNVIPENADANDDSATQLDLLVRGQYNHSASPQLTVFGFFAPGYSVIMLPDDQGNFGNPSGLVVGFGGGVRYMINEKLFAQGELGYQHGFHKLSAMDTEFTFATNYVHFGVGLGSHF
jgi:hypothetical protein